MHRRPRRNRKNSVVRGHIRETHLHTENLILPLFLTAGSDQKVEVPSLPGNYRFSPDRLLAEIEECLELGLRSFVLFPAIEEHLKDREATHSWDAANVYLTTIRAVKERFPEACIVTDVA
ncbi:MAG: porphobilinogen synthase, partial [Bacteroidota bacterium]